MSAEKRSSANDQPVQNELDTLLTRDQVNQLITSRLRTWRYSAWENDLSSKSQDEEPFENGPPICDRLHELRNIGQHVPASLLGEVEIREMAAQDRAPIPNSQDREGYLPGNDGAYWLSGLADFLKITKVATELGIAVDRYFDFGCASGRVIRHFAAQTNISEIWASDINARHIRWLCEFMPHRVIPMANFALPTFPIADQSIDLVSAFSVFTHIDTFETCWLAEIRRILCPGGVAYLTIHNEDTWSSLREVVDDPENRLVRAMIRVDGETPLKILGPLPQNRIVYRTTELGPYRAQVFHSNDYVRNVWGRFLDVLEILPRHHGRQAVVILRKKNNGSESQWTSPEASKTNSRRI
jgi:SAM-dependent methyltransferase